MWEMGVYSEMGVGVCGLDLSGCVGEMGMYIG